MKTCVSQNVPTSFLRVGHSVQVGLQHSVHLHMKKKRAKYQKILELFRLIKSKEKKFAKAEEDLVDSIKSSIVE